MIQVTQRIYRDRDGKPTLDSKKAISLFYPEGMQITEEQAKDMPKEALSTGGGKAKTTPAETKAIKPDSKANK